MRAYTSRPYRQGAYRWVMVVPEAPRWCETRQEWLIARPGAILISAKESKKSKRERRNRDYE